MIDISVTINAPLDDVWNKWTSVDAVQYWAFASDDWAAEGIENNIVAGGSFSSRNFAKDGSVEFILDGTYSTVDPQKHVAYTLSDGRKVTVSFTETSEGVVMDQSFEPENQNAHDLQKEGWQAYLNNFKKYVESTITK